MIQTSHPSTWKADEAERIEFKVNLGYVVRLCQRRGGRKEEEVKNEEGGGKGRRKKERRKGRVLKRRIER